MPARSIAQLTGLLASGEKVKYLLFWGHQPQRDGSIGAGCLSQWWPARFTIDGREFATAEHWMMWSKAILFDDTDAADSIINAGHPHRAKALGRQVRGFDQTVWDTERYKIVVEGSLAKFSQHPGLLAFLLATGDRVLVEASPVDPVWGIGLAADDPRTQDPAQWLGLNLLGFALMEARAALREGSPQ